MRSTILLAVLLILGSTTLIVAPPALPDQGLTVHAPIEITSNADFTPANGVTRGSGLVRDPFVISGWDITVPSGGLYGVRIYDVTAPFVVRDMWVRSQDDRPWYNLSRGLDIGNVTRAWIQNVTILGFTWGIVASQGSFDISDVSATPYSETVAATFVENSTISDVSADSGDGGIRVGSSHGVRIAKSQVHNTEDVLGDGIGLWDSTDVIVDSVMVYKMGYLASGRGMYAFNSTNVSIVDSYFGFVDHGIELGQVRNVTIVDSMVSSAHAVVFLTTQLPFRPPSANVGIVAYHNTFSNYTHPVENDGAAWGTWDLGYPEGGNYWSAYRGEDECRRAAQDDCSNRDGMGDVPYYGDAAPSPTGFVDRYPLVRPYPLPTIPPTGRLFTSPTKAEVGESITFYATSSEDVRDPPSWLQVRWDFDGDGSWDTGWISFQRTIYSFHAPGTYVARLAVRNTAGLTSYATASVQVTPAVAPFDPFVTLAAVVAILGLTVGVLYLGRRRPRR